MVLSFIIPVYNSSQFLDRCLQSIINQGLDVTEYEIILVDDKSTDNSVDICKEYVQKYSNISLIENGQNIGQGFSRNKGLEIAKGKYIHFVDSDDYLVNDSVRKYIHYCEPDDSPDVIQFARTALENRKCNECLHEKNSQKHDSELIILCPLWANWLKRSTIENYSVVFTNGRIGEDILFLARILENSPTSFYIESCIYRYILNEKSTSNRYDISLIIELISVVGKLKRIKDNKISSLSYYIHLNDIITKFYSCHRSIRECALFKKELKENYLYNVAINGTWYRYLIKTPLCLHLYLAIKYYMHKATL